MLTDTCRKDIEIVGLSIDGSMDSMAWKKKITSHTDDPRWREHLKKNPI